MSENLDILHRKLNWGTGKSYELPKQLIVVYVLLQAEWQNHHSGFPSQLITQPSRASSETVDTSAWNHWGHFSPLLFSFLALS